MSGLQNFLAPFSHLLYANRNFFIILLCLVLFLVAVDALVHRWRTARLQTDLSTARSAASNSGARRYVTAQPVEEAPAESGGLPPVKGGRTYARNLGSALHKAGMAAPQIYSPPTPAGWAPSANPAQAAPQRPLRHAECPLGRPAPTRARAMGLPGRRQPRRALSTTDPDSLLSAACAIPAARHATVADSAITGTRSVQPAAGHIRAAELPGSDKRPGCPHVCPTPSSSSGQCADLSTSYPGACRRSAIGSRQRQTRKAQAPPLQLQRAGEPREDGSGQAG
jgi:hypothetical protein